MNYNDFFNLVDEVDWKMDVNLIFNIDILFKIKGEYQYYDCTENDLQIINDNKKPKLIITLTKKDYK